jgi:GNAT superfamily N-acetyltransferase
MQLIAYLANQKNLALVNELNAQSINGVLFLTYVSEGVYSLGASVRPTGTGTGTKLMDHAIELCKSNGTRQILLDVFERNPALKRADIRLPI